VFTLIMWKIKVPSRIHNFLWLLANNKTLTRDNLAKRRVVDDPTCLFCSENETISHLFFHCCVAQTFWGWVSEIAGVMIGTNFESVGKCWLQEKKCDIVNVFSSVVLWTLWKS
jgi:hypothetical protein